MKAVILAAGRGTRMKELTSELPKPMLKWQDKPILEHILEGILAAGIRELFIVTGFRAEVVEEDLVTDRDGRHASFSDGKPSRMGRGKPRKPPVSLSVPRPFC